MVRNAAYNVDTRANVLVPDSFWCVHTKTESGVKSSQIRQKSKLGTLYLNTLKPKHLVNVDRLANETGL